ncbi:MAG: NUDIX hydrolase [Candidatus Huberarchaeum crystalense]|uniref:NUDIX hydrolase n=1 Tax=Huberarchaeum crystalense TaxID=2014257 RepID=A0A2G9LJE0_HUBC1|nr:NUDIX domain-containing protein [archaeon]OIP20811.1 MAG: NUDIX hydrolase [archaeon CG2_30_31_98]PIN66634.1 MAG: NUDIX hydrolase [Candidatus Huberarchaeum crystalense]NCS98495.1 NUDIX domain-containing protein [archaeon]PIV13494.1 MAG: NUDIX hydrolase [Candidatus Huberarchaeum crystalense]
MVEQSAGILLYRFKNSELEVLLIHPGGPFWVKKDSGAWSIPKGKIKKDEKPFDAAKREFKEETGFEVEGIVNDSIYLEELRQPSGKIMFVWALEKDVDETKARSNTLTLEYPKNSGKMHKYFEVDKASWFGIEQAKLKILKGQAGFIDKLIEHIKYIPKEKNENKNKCQQKTLF